MAPLSCARLSRAGTVAWMASKDDDNHEGGVLFARHCSGCHTLSAAGTQGCGNRGERTRGPNLNQRTETYEDALAAIENGGFIGAI